MFILLTFSCFCQLASAQVLNLSSARIAVDYNKAEVYKPSKLLLGGETKFIVKGEPGSKVLLLFSETNNGGEPFGEIKLRIGSVAAKEQGMIDEKGIAELLFSLDGDKTSIGKKLYFEAIIWTKEDFSDAQKARIIEINGQETLNNALVIAPSPKEKALPGFNASLPGIGDVGDTLGAMRGHEDNTEELKQEMYYRQNSLMLRNLHAPEIQKNKNDKDR